MSPREPAPLPAAFSDLPFGAADLSRAGVSVERTRRADLRRVSHGLHRAREAERGEWANLGYPVDPLPWVPEEAAAVVPLTGGVVSHLSALLLHRLTVPPWVRPDGRLHVSRRHGRGVCDRSGVVTHGRSVPQEDVVALHGIAVTSVERTWLDLASLMPRGPVDPLVIAGDALVNRPWIAGDGRRGEPVTSVEALRAALRRAGRFKGVRAARAALDLVRVGADSPPETELRLALVDAGLPEPELQVSGDPGDRFAPVADLGYRDWWLALQYDGGHHRSREQQARDARRDGWFHDRGWRSLRLTADDRLDGFRRAIAWVRRHRP
ncbi:endonuclease domain-containing protein [Micrococcus sp. HG099]|uniref:endonuclease domain-containing protein n=1 Tax=Micrococcus sp. HG099 TaxID=2969755 RepID=UPI00215ABB63|nr:endonuclease domain-containing protein [Micrococcus sp. HG099]MCR8674786.1 endonuclease domain-containing protein [Micrococcus sp. HG099]